MPPPIHQTGSASLGCPIATRDVAINTENRNDAIRNPMIAYGPANPSERNRPFWSAKGRLWGVSERQAKTMRCANCKAFNVSRFIRSCIGPMAEPDSYDESNLSQGVVLGYCEMHKFKCASTRTCNTWVHGGPNKTWSP